MALQLSPQCQICQELQAGNTVLLSRLYASAAYRGRKGEPLLKIAQAYPQFNRKQIANHCQYHQGLTSEDIQRELLKQRDMAETTELAREAIDANEARQLVIDEGVRRIKAGETKVEVTHVMQATKQTADIEAKKTDQNLLMQGMFVKFMSGESTYAGPDLRTEHPDAIDVIPEDAPAPSMGL